MKKFIVTVESPTKDEATEFHQWIKSQNLGWWHWMDPMWLLTSKDEITATKIRDKAKEVFSQKPVMVIEIIGQNRWAGFMPSSKTGGKSPFTWLRTTWLNGGKKDT